MKRMFVALTTMVVMLGAPAGMLGDQVGRKTLEEELPPAVCDIAGTWVGSSPVIPGIYTVPVLGTQSVSPVDPSGQRFTAVVQPVNPDSTFVGLFPDADRTADAVGTYIRSGPRTFHARWVNYFVKSPAAGSFDRGRVLYFWTLSGSVKCQDADTMTLTGMVSLYSNVDRPELIAPPLGIFGVHDQDLDDDGVPDEGEAPFVVLPFDFTFKRF